MYWVACGKRFTFLNAKFWRVPLNGFWGIFNMSLTRPSLFAWQWKKFCCNLFDQDHLKLVD